MWRLITKAFDGLLIRVEAYGALLDQYGLRPSALPYLISGTMMVWSWLGGLALPLAIVAGLVAFAAVYGVRVFAELRHEARQHLPAKATEAAENNSSEIPAAIRHELTRLWSIVVAVDKHAEQMRRISEQHQSLETELRIARDLQPKLSEFELRLDALQKDVSVITDAVGAVFNNSAHLARQILMNNALDHAPDPDAECSTMEERIELATGYVEYVRKSLRYTDIFLDLERNLIGATNLGELRFKETPEHEIPRGVHPDVFRRHLIAMERFARILAFLQHHKRAMPEEPEMHAIGGRIKLH